MNATNEAHENSARTIPDSQLGLLKKALMRERGANGDRQSERNIIRQLCLLPEVRSLAPEQFVLSVKMALNVAATDVGVPLAERQQVISRLLSISIEEFFAADGDRIAASKINGNGSHRSRVHPTSAKDVDGDCRGRR